MTKLYLGYEHNDFFTYGGDIPKDQLTDFTDDCEKMIDFWKLSKKEFLETYEYLYEEEYDLTYQKVGGKQN